MNKADSMRCKVCLKEKNAFTSLGVLITEWVLQRHVHIFYHRLFFGSRNSSESFQPGKLFFSSNFFSFLIAFSKLNLWYFITLTNKCIANCIISTLCGWFLLVFIMHNPCWVKAFDKSNFFSKMIGHNLFAMKVIWLRIHVLQLLENHY